MKTLPQDLVLSYFDMLSHQKKHDEEKRGEKNKPQDEPTWVELLTNILNYPQEK